MKKESFRKPSKTLLDLRLSSFIFCVRLMVFSYCQTFGEGIDFCFDGSNEGEFLLFIIAYAITTLFQKSIVVINEVIL